MILIAAGREAQVFEHGPGLVLRRFLDGRSVEREAETMRALAAAGFPVPRIESADGPDLVMQRVDGPTMAEALLAGALDPGEAGRLLAELHLRLHEIPWGDAPGTLMHGDLHPENVILGEDGPVVIDWTNARPGPAGLDVALTAVIGAQVVVAPEALSMPPEIEAVAVAVMREVLAAFAAAVPRSFLDHVDEAVDIRAGDGHTTAEESARVGEAGALVRELAER